MNVLNKQGEITAMTPMTTGKYIAYAYAGMIKLNSNMIGIKIMVIANQGNMAHAVISKVLSREISSMFKTFDMAYAMSPKITQILIQKRMCLIKIIPMWVVYVKLVKLVNEV